MTEPWQADAAGLLALPSGRLVRGRSLRRPPPDGPLPTYGVYLLGRAPDPVPWDSTWIPWPDFRLPRDRVQAAGTIRGTWQRLTADRVEVACAGGRGRTGTVLACLVAIDDPGVDPVAYVRRRYDRKAVETPGQRRYVAAFLG